LVNKTPLPDSIPLQKKDLAFMFGRATKAGFGEYVPVMI
jgi:hypothetical protein